MSTERVVTIKYCPKCDDQALVREQATLFEGVGKVTEVCVTCGTDVRAKRPPRPKYTRKQLQLVAKISACIALDIGFYYDAAMDNVQKHYPQVTSEAATERAVMGLVAGAAERLAEIHPRDWREFKDGIVTEICHGDLSNIGKKRNPAKVEANG